MSRETAIHKIRKFFEVIRNNGGIYKTLRNLYRIDEVKMGTLIGTDSYGNKYYENNSYFFSSNRWVVYSDQFGLDYDASQVSPEWYGWLHYKSDLPPHKDPSRPKYKWLAPQTQNFTGTNLAYMPYTTVKPKIEAWKPPQ